MPDLAGAVAAVARLMTDTVTVTRDAQGPADDVLDERTGRLVAPPGDSRTVWTGPWLVTPTAADRAVLGPLAAVVPDATASYRGLLPLTAPPLAPGDVLTCTLARRDPQLTARRFRVRTAPEVGTFAVARIVTLDLL